MYHEFEKKLVIQTSDINLEIVGHNNYKTKEIDKEKYKNSIILELEYALLKKIKNEEQIRMKELEWQCLQAKTKKSYYFNKSKRMAIREEELRKFSKNITYFIKKSKKMGATK